MGRYCKGHQIVYMIFILSLGFIAAADMKVEYYMVKKRNSKDHLSGSKVAFTVALLHPISQFIDIMDNNMTAEDFKTEGFVS